MAPDPDIELRRMIGSYLRPCAAPAPLWSNQGQLRAKVMRYAIIVDDKGNTIGTAELIGQTWRGQVSWRRLEAWRGNLLTVAKGIDEAAHRAILLAEPIWLFGEIIA